jgi:copper chaperone CopZ
MRRKKETREKHLNPAERPEPETVGSEKEHREEYPHPTGNPKPDPDGGLLVSDLTLHGMHCDSCAKIIDRTVSKHIGARVREFDLVNNRMILEYSSEKQLEKIRIELIGKGYQTLLPGEKAEDGFEAGSLHRGIDFLRNVASHAPGFEAERTLFTYSTDAVFIVLAVQAALYMLVFRSIPGFLYAYWSVTLLTAVAVVALLFAYYHVNAFRKTTSCMTGMMSGMTFGMAGGFLIGAYAGATNGMFVGSIVGMGIGIGLGYFSGRYCGVMGVMEGIMGGLMAGTMGAMLSVMMIFDNLIPFLFILTGIEAVILLAFSYMLYKEYGNMKLTDVKVSGTEFALQALALNLALTVVFVYGPKAGVVLGG